MPWMIGPPSLKVMICLKLKQDRLKHQRTSKVRTRWVPQPPAASDSAALVRYSVEVTDLKGIRTVDAFSPMVCCCIIRRKSLPCAREGGGEVRDTGAMFLKFSGRHAWLLHHKGINYATLSSTKTRITTLRSGNQGRRFEILMTGPPPNLNFFAGPRATSSLELFDVGYIE